MRISDWSSDVCSSDLPGPAPSELRDAAWHGQRRTKLIAGPAGDFLSAERGASGAHQPAADDAAVADGRSKGIDPDGRDIRGFHASARTGASRGGGALAAAHHHRDLFLHVRAAWRVGGVAARRLIATRRL